MQKEKSKITKQVKQELKTLLDQKGYWSEEVKEFISSFNYVTAKKLHIIAQVYSKYQYGL